MGGAGGSLDMSSRTLSSLLGVTAAAAEGVARETERPEGPEGPGEDSLFEVSLLLKTPDSPWSLPRLEVDEVLVFLFFSESVRVYCPGSLFRSKEGRFAM
jgi:hypothetical protein